MELVNNPTIVETMAGQKQRLDTILAFMALDENLHGEFITNVTPVDLRRAVKVISSTLLEVTEAVASLAANVAKIEGGKHKA